ncbi:MAG: glycosyltransferase [Candidatus Aminicenantes bacterium]|nr:glycosyltransferase [Candidatus Aminicenantes bacterium]NIM83390.1 glycosyltransferase [Candidatus Aminicenantes bacterium]NIN22782.1 glycosyltransferase [Candidatus Aminicenantes bacterium]NIN46516.1 glycosyltransferase [Candidatus Aminicenantes bacterium]NIN89421.1 glycosyltransferase [Candidatus Aminicenantes bacterium]
MANENKHDYLLEYPFDLYQRSRDIREIVEIITGESNKKKLRILDVGGFRLDAEERDNLLLKEFLPQHEIVTLDVMESCIPGYVRGDGSQLPFKDKSFDMVVTSDVYEHVPLEEREKFLENLLRVAKEFVILGAPFYSQRNALAEQIVLEYIRKVLHAEQEQLKEHIENQLPDADELKKLINHRGLNFICFDSGYLNSWLVMMMVKHYLMGIPDTERLDIMLDRFYNMSFYESDHAGEGYRKVFVIAKEKKYEEILKKIDVHFSAYAEKYQNQRMDALAGSDLSHVRLLLDLEALRTRALLEEKDGLIQHQAVQIAAFEHMRSTRVYRVMQFFNRLLVSPFVFVGRQFLGKMQQLGQVLRGKRRHPFLSVSDGAYRRWLKKHELQLTEEAVTQLKKESGEFKYSPLISIVVPAYNTPQEWLEKAVESVLSQLYENWELCIVNDGSPESQVRETLDHYSKKDNRIKIKHLRRNRGIARATNEALAMVSGECEFIAFMDSDDVLHPLALFEVVKFLNGHPEADVIYTDEDKITLDNRRRRPEFKPDWSPDLFLTYNYINHLTVCRKKLVDDVGGFRAKYNWSQDYDLYLRITEKTDKVFHIPKILYHWREILGSSASKVDFRTEALEKSRQLLSETLRRRGINSMVVDGLRPGTFKIKKQNPLK